MKSCEIHAFSFKKMYLKMSSGTRRPFCLGLNVLSDAVTGTSGWNPYRCNRWRFRMGNLFPPFTGMWSLIHTGPVLCRVLLLRFSLAFFTNFISLALGQSSNCLSANEATLMIMAKYIMWINEAHRIHPQGNNTQLNHANYINNDHIDDINSHKKHPDHRGLVFSTTQ